MSEDLCADLDAQLRKLRGADSQAAAVAWMTSAYRLMERCIAELKDRPAQVVRERLVFVPEKPKLEIVQSVSAFDVRAAKARREELQARSANQTVVNPSVFLPPGLKPLPKAWTHNDTVKLERAARDRVNTQKLKRWAERKAAR